MHKKFNHRDIEAKWQAEWKKSGIYNTNERDASKDKEYVLVEWPYPSGNLHIGHWFAFAVVDMYVRARRMQGKQVIFPIGFDAFGLPAENAAIKHGLDPKAWTESNMAHMREQLESMGNAFSWDLTTSSTDPEYYKWTQWMFTKFLENDVAYRGDAIVNWCPGCNTVIANEQVVDGTCERSGDTIERKNMKQWMLRITRYADRLIDDLETLDWPEHIKDAQKQWIGRSRGAELTFSLSSGDNLVVFTTRPDTVFGATYVVLAPEHDFVLKNKKVISNWNEVENYIQEASKKDEIQRTKAEKEKTGVKLEGITATNPATGEQIPVYIADYVLNGYGTGAIMAVPAHDERDFAFATKYHVPITQVIVPCANDSHNPPQPQFTEVKRNTVIVHLKDKSTGKFALLNWHGTLEGIRTAIMGGIESDQTPEEAALAEIKEEAALDGVVITKKLEWITGARYCASHKNQNRCAHTYSFLAEIENLDSQGTISLEETKIHSLTWVDEATMFESITPDHQKLVWQLLNSPLTSLSGNGYLMNSGEFDGIDSEEAKVAITEKIGGKLTNTYRLRDWSIGRQRYWGVPIPVVYDPEGKPHAIPKEHLPWHLPTDVDFKPTGEAPLAKSRELKERVERIFGKGWTPEVETMDTFVDSSWYFFRYIDAHNNDSFSSEEQQKMWGPIDIYFGGSEHNTMHLLYSRFWTKVLYDLGLTHFSEPYKRRINRGLVLGPDGNKMSKSKGNVIDPDEQVARLGSDTVKMYLAFMGPYGELANYPWDMGGIAGLRRFLERAYGLSEHILESETQETTKLIHKTIKKVTSDIDDYKFNTAISALMVFINHAEKAGLTTETYSIFLKLLSPFAPHVAEELWDENSNPHSIHSESWPVFNDSYVEDSTISLSIQINGKMKGTLIVNRDEEESVVIERLRTDVAFASKIPSTLTRVIYVKNRIINLIG